MPNFLLLLYDDPTVYQKLSPSEMQETLGRYMAWGKKPFVKGGQRLADDPGRVMRGKQVTDGPYSETKEVLAGYYAIEAGNYDQAVQLTRDHPHLDFGTIEVRQFWGP